MGTSAEQVDPDSLDVWADPAAERLLTPATIITFVRTIAAVTIVGFAVHADRSGGFWSPALKLLVVALAVYWVGDMLDGFVARTMGHETRVGAVLDIMSDRFCAAAFYFGLAWIHPVFIIPVLVYLAEFMVIDCFLSIAFLAWRVRSPNYFYVIDRQIYRYNWSPAGKAINSALFAVLLLVTRMPWLGTAIAAALLALKVASLVRLMRLGLPIPPAREAGESVGDQTGPVGQGSPA